MAAAHATVEIGACRLGLREPRERVAESVERKKKENEEGEKRRNGLGQMVWALNRLRSTAEIGSLKTKGQDLKIGKTIFRKEFVKSENKFKTL